MNNHEKEIYEYILYGLTSLNSTNEVDQKKKAYEIFISNLCNSFNFMFEQINNTIIISHSEKGPKLKLFVSINCLEKLASDCKSNLEITEDGYYCSQLADKSELSVILTALIYQEKQLPVKLIIGFDDLINNVNNSKQFISHLDVATDFKLYQNIFKCI